MTITETPYRYVVLNQHGIPIIRGTQTKVSYLAQAQQMHGWTPEELRYHYPHLSMGQIYSALAYYWDHKHAMGADLEQRGQMADDLRKIFESPELTAKLRGTKAQRPGGFVA